MSTSVSVMLAVPDCAAAVAWYREALDATVMWNLGGVAGLSIRGAPVFLHEPVEGKFSSPLEAGFTTARVQLFCDDPDAVISKAAAAGAEGKDVQTYESPWGPHRQGGFTDPFGHVWHVGDRSPLG
ncbi:VOC family protein [Asticcacaulis solisilvae]|uniref:VOC family protein n=1 Tax=Asticcacaulis solisilvae TaxID=1217274 RepID=UPI003FD728AA